MILGIDYGSKRIGLALADENNQIALPYRILENKSDDVIFEEFKKIVKEKDITKIVVGLPLTMKGEFGLKAREIQKFINKMRNIIFIPIVEMDERLSSKLADTLGGEKGKNRDIGAAMIILDGYLSQQKKR